MEPLINPTDKQLVLSKYKKLLNTAGNNLTGDDRAFLKKAFVISLNEYGHQLYINKESWFSHSVDVACIISKNMGMGLTSVISALLANVSR